MSPMVDEPGTPAAGDAAGDGSGDATAVHLRDALMTAARAAREHAYAPYSGFAVGAAVLDEAGRIHAGCNVENAAYPQGWCAEASALAAMVLAGGRRVMAAAVFADVPDAQSPVTPCGGCRQKLREFAADDCPVYCGHLHGIQAVHTLGRLLPHGFGPQHLPQHRPPPVPKESTPKESPPP